MRQCIRYLDALREVGRLTDGVKWSLVRPTVGPSGTVRIDIARHERPDELKADTPDNRIISVAHWMREKGQRAVFVSKDINARIKADALGIKAEDFENQKVDADSLYTGYVSVLTPTEIIDDLYKNRMLPLERLAKAPISNGNGKHPPDAKSGAKTKGNAKDKDKGK
jgi:PhoH-like ATPase